MNYQQLLEMQEQLDQHIIKKQKLQFIKLSNLVLALSTEISEVANAYQKWKYWKVNNEPRYKRTCHACRGNGEFTTDIWNGEKEPCGYCDGTGIESEPLIEEVAEVLHFLLSLSNRFYIDGETINKIGAVKYTEVETHFLEMQYTASMIGVFGEASDKQHYVKIMWKLFKGMLEHLGFTEEEIFEAYLKKNKINYERHATNY